MEVPAGQVNFRVSLPSSANNVLQPRLHPGHWCLPKGIFERRVARVYQTESLICMSPITNHLTSVNVAKKDFNVLYILFY